MEIFRVNELGRDGIAQVAGTQLFAHGSVFGCDVAALYHEILDHAVKEQAVVGALFDQFDKVIAVPGRFVV